MRLTLSLQLEIGGWSIEAGLVPLPLRLPPWHMRVCEISSALDWRPCFTAAVWPFALLIKWPVRAP
jgi:hypothetical protein